MQNFGSRSQFPTSDWLDAHTRQCHSCGADVLWDPLLRRWRDRYTDAIHICPLVSAVPAPAPPARKAGAGSGSQRPKWKRRGGTRADGGGRA